MTSLTTTEIKTISFGLTLLAIIGVFVSLYAQQPIPQQQYTGESNSATALTSGSSSWISGIIGALPSPFNDVNLLIITSIFVTPVAVLLGYIAVRALKDLISQWV